MEGKTETWPVLKSCMDQCCYEAKDLLSRLPDDILCFIMSFLTLKEVARIGILSHRWNYLWQCFPILVFEDLPAMKRLFPIKDLKSEFQERLNFSNWVNQVVEAHRGLYVDEMKVTFDLDRRFQPYLDNWLVFAIAKQVKRLQLDFSSPVPGVIKKDLLPKWRISRDKPQTLSFFKSCLRSLTLKFISISTKDFDCLFRSCLVLESLSIFYSPTLKYVRSFGLPLQLKHLEVSYCRHLKAIDILAPKLLSFKQLGNPVKLHIRNASMLSKLSFGSQSYGGEIVNYVFDSLSKYFPQLEYLSCKMRMSDMLWMLPNRIQYNLGINNPPSMKNLKHLELDVFVACNESLLGWANLIEASPLLERLTLKFMDWDGDHTRTIMRRKGRPLKSLKTLELYEELGLPIDLEFATYVVENSIMLKDVIVELRPLEDELSKYVSVEDQVAKLKQIVPQGVNFALNILPPPPRLC